MTEQPKSAKKWTVMVFMGADNLPGEADLTEEARKDIAEMTRVMTEPDKNNTQNDTLNVFVQLHGKDSVTRHHIGRGKPSPVPDSEQNATNGQALIAFMRWAIKSAGHDKHDYSLLVLWGHAYRFGIGHTATREGTDALDFAELAAVLTRFQDEHRKIYDLAEAPKLEIVGFDACDLATIEMAFQLHPFADYMIASQIAIPLPGWPYYRILERIKVKQGARMMGPAEFGSYIVRRFCESYHAEQLIVSLTMLDLKRAPELKKLTDGLARSLALALADDPNEQDVVINLFNRSQTIEDKPFVDVADLCVNLMRFSRDVGVRDAAQQLGSFLITPKPVTPGASETGEGRPFVLEHGRNAGQTARLHGVSLYAPHVAPIHDPAAASYFYEKFVFAKDTLWNELVRGLALPS